MIERCEETETCNSCKHKQAYIRHEICTFGLLPTENKMSRILPDKDFIEKSLLCCTCFDAKMPEKDDYHGLYLEEHSTLKGIYDN